MNFVRKIQLKLVLGGRNMNGFSFQFEIAPANYSTFYCGFGGLSSGTQKELCAARFAPQQRQDKTLVDQLKMGDHK